MISTAQKLVILFECMLAAGYLTYVAVEYGTTLGWASFAGGMVGIVYVLGTLIRH